MAIERIFLDWKQPFLPQAAEWIVSRHPAKNLLDLRHLRIALPGARAARRLVELLVEKSEQRKTTLIPPRIVTTGALPEQLYESNFRLACSFERHMAWLQALEDCDPEAREILLPRPPEKGNLNAWFSLAQRLDRLYSEIASGGLTFAAVAEHCEKASDVFADERWQILADLHAVFSGALEARDLGDVHHERFLALEESRCHYSGELLLLAAGDLPLLTRKMVLQNTGRCFALVHAPEKSFASFFDELGCVVSSKWADLEIPIEDSCLHFCRNPAEQARAVVTAIAALKGKVAPEEICIGSCAAEAKPYLIEALREKELPLADASGYPLERTAPITFLKLAADYLHSRSFFSFATLVRHPEVQRAVLASKHLTGLKETGRGLLSILDEYQSEHLQAALADELPAAKKQGHFPSSARMALEELLGDLCGAPRNLAQWATAIAALLVRLFGNAPLNPGLLRDSLILSACGALHEEISKLNTFSPAEDSKISAAQAIRLLLSQISGQTVEVVGSDPAIDILGWLELQLDDAPVMMITSLNEGKVPETINSDPFLPNSLRAALGLLDNDRRYARDAYALSAILKSRVDVKIFATRLDAQGSPLRPSRLVFACAGEQIAQRIKTFFESTQESDPPELERDSPLAVLAPPMPVRQPQAPQRMSVTGFRDYLECPYRYYLKHILKLRSLDDSALELDSAAAGTILHDVLTDFGRNCAQSAATERQISDFLLGSLAQRFDEVFGSSPLSTVRVQRLQAEARLKAFAAWQARWSASGWEIKHAELEFNSPEFNIELPKGGKMLVQGRIDRVDYNPQRAEWFVFDYKTGDAGDSPKKTHMRRETWINLQLPLYQHLLRQAGTKESIRLGYIILPADLGRLKEEEAAWSDGEIESALSAASGIAQSVHDQIFWPPKELRRSAYDDYKILFPEDFAIEDRGAA